MDIAAGKGGIVLVSMIKVNSVHLAYGSQKILRDITFSVSAGEVVGLVGPNGAGKTTLIRAISGLLKPSSGGITVANDNVFNISNKELAKMISVVPQAEQTGGAFLVRNVISLGRTPYMNWLGQSTEKDSEAVDVAMLHTGIEDLGDRRLAELSGGERQRVLLARALAQETPILLLDEPTSNLDLVHQGSFLSLISELARQKNLAVLMALHDLNLVSSFADRVIMIADQTIIAEGLATEVLTAENIMAAYQTSAVEIIAHPDSGNPIIIPKNQK